VVFPKQQWAQNGPIELKTKGSSAPIPIPRELTLMLSASVQQFPGPTLVTDGKGNSVGPWVVEREVRAARGAMKLDGLHFHCLPDHLATLLINDGCDVKTVQNRMRHGSAKDDPRRVRAHVGRERRNYPRCDWRCNRGAGGVV
jgi:integrase